MSDKETPGSGSRWEPPPPPPEIAPQQSDAFSPVSSGGRPPWPGIPARRPRLGGRGVLAGTAVALVALGGLGGLVLGNVTDGDDRVGLVSNGAPADGPERSPGLPPGLGDGSDHDDDPGFGTPPDLDDDEGGGDDVGTGSESGEDEGPTT